MRAAEAEHERRLAEGAVQLPFKSVGDCTSVWIPGHFTARLIREYIAVRRMEGGVALTQIAQSVCTCQLAWVCLCLYLCLCLCLYLFGCMCLCLCGCMCLCGCLCLCECLCLYGCLCLCLCDCLCLCLCLCGRFQGDVIGLSSNEQCSRVSVGGCGTCPCRQAAYDMPDVTRFHVTLLFEGNRLDDEATCTGADLTTGSAIRVIVRAALGRPESPPFPPPSLARCHPFPPLLARRDQHDVVTAEHAATNFVRACLHGSMDDVRAALDAGAAVNDIGIDFNGLAWTPLRAAVFSKRPDVVALLLSLGGDPNGDTVMHSGVLNGTADIVQQLLDAGGDVNAESFGVRPVFVAAASADEAVIRVLLSDRTLDLSVRMEGKTADEWARERGRATVADMIHDEVS